AVSIEPEHAIRSGRHEQLSVLVDRHANRRAQRIDEERPALRTDTERGTPAGAAATGEHGQNARLRATGRGPDQQDQDPRKNSPPRSLRKAEDDRALYELIRGDGDRLRGAGLRDGVARERPSADRALARCLSNQPALHEPD